MFQNEFEIVASASRLCPVWMQHMVDQLQCDSCLESNDAQNAPRVSLATPAKMWQAVKVDIFELEDSQRKGFFHSTWMQPANCRRAHAFWKGILVSVSSRLSFHIWPRIGCSIAHSFNFLTSDPGGCFFSNELREWAGVRGIGLLTVNFMGSRQTGRI